MAAPGDWPWHVALFRDDTHVCDGTLVSSDWVLTTESCFQGQPKATWIAVFGSIRLNAQAPWTQRRRIIGMVKSPVEGSTAALIRLETTVVFSNFVRPICLSDQLDQAKGTPISPSAKNHQINNLPHSEQLIKRNEKRSNKLIENRQYFVAPLTAYQVANVSGEYNAEFSDDRAHNPRAEALGQYQSASATQFSGYPLPARVPQTINYYESKPLIPGYANKHYQGQQQVTPRQLTATPSTPEWTNCNTLGWSRQRDHLQRVQLKIGDMAACENVSIATVNSVCAEAAFHKQDCTEEEFAGSPVMCTQADGKQWALVAISSWRIACAQSGIERPRMYDKITSNAAWIRDTVNSV